MYLSPVNMIFRSEPTATGTPELASFCRELVREAALLAGRHLLTGDDGDSGAGY
jgi:hypothetical protein